MSSCSYGFHLPTYNPCSLENVHFRLISPQARQRRLLTDVRLMSNCASCPELIYF